MNSTTKDKHGKECSEVEFTIDGRKFSVFDPKQAPGDLLQLAGLDPCGYDLAQLCHGKDPHRLKDDARVKIRSGDRFVSIRQRATVA